MTFNEHHVVADNGHVGDHNAMAAALNILVGSGDAGPAGAALLLCVQVAGAYPARPVTAGAVAFIGTTDPTAIAVDGDFWVDIS